jgi:hypothetical protein
LAGHPVTALHEGTYSQCRLDTFKRQGNPLDYDQTLKAPFLEDEDGFPEETQNRRHPR